jgi:DNA-binding PadR family transcriptional regulator
MTSPVRTISARAALTESEYAVLGLLSGGEASGYELAANAQRNVNLILAPAKSRIYHLLPRLLERGLVTRRRVDQDTRPDKHVYRLTEAGWETFRGWLDDTSAALTRPQLLLKLFFGAHADPAALLVQLRDYREQTAGELRFFESLERENLDDEDGFHPNLTVWCALALDRALLRWTDRTIAAIEAR